MNLKIIKIIFDKVALIQLPKVNDNRGNFLKIFSNTLAFKKNLNLIYKKSFIVPLQGGLLGVCIFRILTLIMIKLLLV